MTTKTRLDEIVLRNGWVTEAQLVQALKEQDQSGGRLGSVLVKLGFLSETQLAEALAEQFNLPKWDPETAILEESALKLFPEQWLRQRGVIPLAYDKDKRQLEVAVTDPTNVGLQDEIRFQGKIKNLIVTVIPEVSFKRVWQRYKRQKETPSLAKSSPKPDKLGETLGLHFTFGFIDQDADFESGEVGSQSATGVLMWLSQPFIAKLLKSLLEAENCRVVNWDGVNIPEGEWSYLIYDNDQVASQPRAMSTLRKAIPQLQVIPRPSWTTSLLRSPLSYERLRDGYIHLAEFVSQRFADGYRDRRLSRYALAAARILPMTQYEIDSLMVACELTPILTEDIPGLSFEDDSPDTLQCPYPVLDIYRTSLVPFADTGTKPGQSDTEYTLAGKVYAVTRAFLQAAEQEPINSIESLSSITDWLRSEAGNRFDPVVVEAMLRVVQEEVLDGCLPPGPLEVLMVADHPVEWSHLVMQLENEGWRVVQSKGATEAKRQVDRRTPDAAIWAADGALEWIEWLKTSEIELVSFLILEEPDTALERAALESGFEDVWTGQWDPGVAIAKLKRGVKRSEKSGGLAATVAGSLQQLSFVDMIQVLAASGRSVRIELQSNNRKGSVVLWQGQIKFAQANTLTGEQAVFDILTWDTGSFTLHPIDTPPNANCTMPNEMILLEGCRLMDESKRDNAAVKV